MLVGEQVILPFLNPKCEGKTNKTKLQSRVTGESIGDKNNLKKRSFKDVLVHGKNRSNAESKSVRCEDELCSLNAINPDCNKN